eukprot:Sdes_comp19885_c0_seq1m12211
MKIHGWINLRGFVIFLFGFLIFLQKTKIVNANNNFVINDADYLESWSYSYQPGWPLGPKDWGQLYPECYKESQSPVYIDPNSTTFDPELRKQPLMLVNHTNVTGFISNNKKSIVVDGFEEPPILNVFSKYDNMDRKRNQSYILAQYHFHWSSSYGTFGSEHVVGDQESVLEVHVVYYKSEYKSYEAAQRFADGIVVMSGRYSPIAWNHQSNSLEGNSQISKLLDNFEKMGESGGRVGVQSGINIASLLRDDNDERSNVLWRYYNYHGSFTTPPCSQVVQWFILDHHLTVSYSQWERFQNLSFLFRNETHSIGPNIRPLQKLNQRLIFRSFELKEETVEGILRTLQVAWDNIRKSFVQTKLWVSNLFSS